MLPDNVLTRTFLRATIGLLDSVAPLSALYLVGYWLAEAPPALLLFSLAWVEDHHVLLWWVTAYCSAEALWLAIHRVGRALIARGLWDYRNRPGPLETEERWRVWIKMVESSRDPWDWLGGFFSLPVLWGPSAPTGARDPLITTIRPEDVGQDNIIEWIAHFLFNRSRKAIKSKSTEAAELHSMLVLLESAMSDQRGGVTATGEPRAFRFRPGKTRHRPFLVFAEELRTSHHPLLFYITIFLLTELGNLGLFLAGFRYYGPRKSWPFPLFFMRGSRSALDALNKTEDRGADSHLADRVGYWYHPGSDKALKDGKTPVIFLHGISGTYGPAAFIVYLQRLTGRPFLVPEYPYVTMRLSPPSSIFTRRETVAACRRALWRHGFGDSHIEEDESDAKSTESQDDHEGWRRAKTVVVAHSLGSSACAWLLRDAPDLIEGVVLIDPMSVMLFCADSMRNFFRTKSTTAGEIFFQYFASERGITHFLSRHLRWTDSVVFAPNAVNPLSAEVLDDFVPRVARDPLEAPFDIPNYAPSLYPVHGAAVPFPTRVFLSEHDCIIPVGKVHSHLLDGGMPEEDVVIMQGLDHAAILTRPGWVKEVARAIDAVSP